MFMGQRRIITEEEKKKILSLYEQSEDTYQKENNFLKRYIGKTVNLYENLAQTEMYQRSYKIEKIEYTGGGIFINNDGHSDDNYIAIWCNYNPNKIGYKMNLNTNYKYTGSKSVDLYNKKLIDDINTYGLQAGITWCKKPKADYSSTQQNMNQSKIG
jgi:hypothetical protein